MTSTTEPETKPRTLTWGEWATTTDPTALINHMQAMATPRATVLKLQLALRRRLLSYAVADGSFAESLRRDIEQLQTWFAPNVRIPEYDVCHGGSNDCARDYKLLHSNIAFIRAYAEVTSHTPNLALSSEYIWICDEIRKLVSYNEVQEKADISG